MGSRLILTETDFYFQNKSKSRLNFNSNFFVANEHPSDERLLHFITRADCCVRQRFEMSKTASNETKRSELERSYVGGYWEVSAAERFGRKNAGNLQTMEQSEQARLRECDADKGSNRSFQKD